MSGTIRIAIAHNNSVGVVGIWGETLNNPKRPVRSGGNGGHHSVRVPGSASPDRVNSTTGALNINVTLVLIAPKAYTSYSAQEPDFICSFILYPIMRLDCPMSQEQITKIISPTDGERFHSARRRNAIAIYPEIYFQ